MVPDSGQRKMSDAEAYMALALNNAQNELSLISRFWLFVSGVL
jgi:hypothetical protein